MKLYNLINTEKSGFKWIYPMMRAISKKVCKDVEFIKDDENEHDCFYVKVGDKVLKVKKFWAHNLGVEQYKGERKNYWNKQADIYIVPYGSTCGDYRAIINY